MEAPSPSWLPASRRWQPAIIVIYGAIAGRAQRWRAKNSRRDVPAEGDSRAGGGPGAEAGRAPGDAPAVGWQLLAAGAHPCDAGGTGHGRSCGGQGEGDVEWCWCCRPWVVPLQPGLWALPSPWTRCKPALVKWAADGGHLSGPVMAGLPL